ncbi:MAG: GGDEF domain-containing protein, partial [Rectinema sp.]
RMLRLDGEPFWGEVSAKRIPVSASGPGIILYMIRDISTKKHAEDDLRNLLVTDELTGLFNRRGFMIAADQELKHAKRIGKSVVMLFMDVDDLKDVNDKFGHIEGDALLRELASVLRSTFRESDIVARLGGDEFVVLALDVPEGSAASLVNRLHATLESRDASSAKPYRLAVSMGTTLYNPAEPCSLSELITDADSLMYLDKKSKKH